MDTPNAAPGEHPWAPPPPGRPQHLVPPQAVPSPPPGVTPEPHVTWVEPVPYAYPVQSPAFGPGSWTSPAPYGMRPRRPNGRRVAIFAGFVAGWAAAAFVLMAALVAIVASNVNPRSYATDAAYDAALDARVDGAFPLLFGVWGALLLVGQLVLGAVLARRVAYRWFDTFRQLVPVYGWYFIGKILWRCTDAGARRASPTP